MQHKFICEKVNVRQCPKPDAAPFGNQLTLPDQHGSALNFLFTLVKHAVVEIAEDKFNRFVAIYDKDPEKLTASDLAEIASIIFGLKVKRKVFIRLIGDILADRGMNDYFILLMLAMLQKNGLEYEILLSNHDFNFLQGAESKTMSWWFNSSDDPDSARGPVFARSAHNLQKLIASGKITAEQVTHHVETVYKPASKLISYSINTNGEMTIYSHAPIDEEVIDYLARKFGILYKDETPSDLIATINAINKIYQEEYVKKGKICELPDSLRSERKSDPVTYLTHNRNTDELKRNRGHKRYKLTFVHGHDFAKEEKDVFILNTMLNEYRALLSDVPVTQPELAPKTEQKAERKEEPKVESKVEPKVEVGVEVPLQQQRSTPDLSLTSSSSKVILNTEEQDYLNQLEVMRLKSDELSRKSKIRNCFSKRRSDAADAASALHTGLKDAFDTYLKSDKKIAAYNAFAADSKKLINQHRPELEKYRGLGSILANALVMISLIGIAICGIMYCFTGRFFPFPSDSAKKLDVLENKLAAIPITHKAL